MSRNFSWNGNDHIRNELIRKFVQEHQQQQPANSLQKLQPHQQMHMHSAGESSCCSSQEFSNDDQPFLAANTSQVALDSDIKPNVIPKRLCSCLFEHNYPNSQDSIYSNSEVTSHDASFILESEAAGGDDGNGALSKCDSLASTASAVSTVSLSELSQSSIESKSATATNLVASRMLCGAASESKSLILGDGNVTMTTAAAIDTVPSTINRIDSHTVTSTQMPIKRKIDLTGGIYGVDIDDDELFAKKSRVLHEMDSLCSERLCMICLSAPKNGAFVHSQKLHVCCCYQCSVKVWNKRKQCPLCNLRVKSVLRMYVQ